MRVLLTGGRGFVGARLAATLRARHPDWLVEAPDRDPTFSTSDALDVTDATSVDRWVQEYQPEVVVHLAAVASVTTATRDPRLAWRVNLEGTLNLVLAVQTHAPSSHLMLISSAEVYGRSLDSPEPVNETSLMRPVNPYAASKAAADLLVQQAGEAGLPTSVMRPFNHTGPGQSELFVAPAFAAQIARIEAGRQPPEVLVGNLDEVRDFLDVDDVVDAYADVLDIRALVRAGTVLNVASGHGVKVGDLLETLLGLSRMPVSIRSDPSRLRSTSVPKIIGDASNLRALAAWQPRRGINGALARLLDYERARIKFLS